MGVDGQSANSLGHPSAWHRRLYSSLVQFLFVAVLNGVCFASADTSTAIRVQGSGVPPHLTFACCERGIAEMQSLFADPGLILSLHKLQATVAIPILDFTAPRAEVVRHLYREGIPIVAWIVLPKEQGYYLTADNEAEAATWVDSFEQWTRQQGLHWAAVGLDIEPNVADLAQLRGHPWRLFSKLLGRSMDAGRIRRARKAYSTLIDSIRARGYVVQTYQMPYIPAERRVHSTLLDRLLGTVYARGDEDYVMLYTSNARPVGAGMIWSLGPGDQGIVIGSTDGDGVPGSGNGPLDWNEFSRDLIVASHFTERIGVYDLEGCVRQGFLTPLLTVDWNGSVEIPAASIQRARRFGVLIRSALWIGSNLSYLIPSAFFLIVICIWWRRRVARKRRGTQLQFPH